MSRRPWLLVVAIAAICALPPASTAQELQPDDVRMDPGVQSSHPAAPTSPLDADETTRHTPKDRVALYQAVERSGDGLVDVIVDLDTATTDRVDVAGSRSVAARFDDVATVLSARSARSRMTHRFSAVPAAIMKVDGKGLDALLAHPDVGSVRVDEPLYRVELGSTTRVIGARAVRRRGLSGAGIYDGHPGDPTIVVIDSGVDPRVGSIVTGACFSRSGDCPNGRQEAIGRHAGRHCRHSVNCWHGTHVASIAVDGKGVAPASFVISINVASDVEGDRAWIYQSDFNKALDHVVAIAADHNLVALNLSLGSARTWRAGRCDDAYPVTTRLLRRIRRLGIVPIAAAGNGGVVGRVAHPACVSHVISVGATDDDDTPMPWSNRGPGMDLWAPGKDVRARVPYPGSRARASGTSMAVPHVAGALAVLTDCPGRAADRPALLRDTGVPVRAGALVVPRLDVLNAVDATTPNDRFAQALEIPSEGGQVQGNNVCATGEQQHGLRGRNTIWWKWTAPADLPVSVSTESGEGQTTFDTTLQVFRGGRVGALDMVAFNNNADPHARGVSRLTFNAVEGVTYRVRVTGGMRWERGRVNVILDPVAQPLCRGVPATIWGTHAPDDLVGTDGPDVIHALGGNDTVEPGLGDDLVCLGAGFDVLVDVGSGDDRVFGGGDGDRVHGGRGNDLLVGGDGADVLRGHGGNDRLVGGREHDDLYGGPGNDVLLGSDGLDDLRAGPGDDSLVGGQGPDWLYGEEGADHLDGGRGQDVLSGGGGNDILMGGGRNDGLRGGDGDDELFGDVGDDVLEGEEGADLLDGGSGDDDCDGGTEVDEAVACEVTTDVP